MILREAIKQAVAVHDVDPTVLGRLVDKMRFQHRLNYSQVCAAIIESCPELKDEGTVDGLLYACDEADTRG